MAKVNIVVGSVMGTSLEVAQAAKTVLESSEHTVAIYENFSPENAAVFDPQSILLVCCSSTGMGDLPQNIAPFYQVLTTQFPPIAGMAYGVISLGDSSYPNFAQAGKTIDEALADIGAARLGEILILDATQTQNHTADAQAWLTEWANLLPQ
ncbi:MAG: flavodoxin domain-containing protein [Agarilytica sp.]